MLQRMPRALLLLLKTNDCLRAVDKELGQAVNTFAITARYVSEGKGKGVGVHHRQGLTPPCVFGGNK